MTTTDKDLHKDSSSTDTQKTSSKTVITPRANLYAHPDGWLVVSALSDSIREQIRLTTEGTTLKLFAPRQDGKEYQRTFRFPKGTTWGELSATWEGELLHIELKKSQPSQREILIS